LRESGYTLTLVCDDLTDMGEQYFKRLGFT